MTVGGCELRIRIVACTRDGAALAGGAEPRRGLMSRRVGRHVQAARVVGWLGMRRQRALGSQKTAGRSARCRAVRRRQ